MCYYSKQGKAALTLEKRFKAKVKDPARFSPAIYNGFQFPSTPVITNKEEGSIQLYSWGLIPFWAKETSIRAKTLNARIETIESLPSFRSSIKNRCLVLADGFYEWHWLDEKGNKKQKYLITLPDEAPFAFAGLYSEWVDKSTGEIFHTYTVVSTAADAFMSEVHNSKKRMPVILTPENEYDWLSGESVVDFAKPVVELVKVEV